MVDLGAIARYEPKWPAVKELNLQDQWRARWNETGQLPEHAPVQRVYALLFLADKGYAVRTPGESVWGMIEGDPEGAPVDKFLKDQAKSLGVTLASTELTGFYECRPTRHNTEYQPDDTVVRPLYILVAKTVKDTPGDSPWERRRFPQNEYAVAMRARYPELLDQLVKAFARYAVIHAQSR